MGCHHAFGGAEFEDGAGAEMAFEDPGVVMAGAGGDAGQIPGVLGHVFESLLFGGVDHGDFRKSGSEVEGSGVGGGGSSLEPVPEMSPSLKCPRNRGSSNGADDDA